MSEGRLQLALFGFLFFGGVFGYLIGRIRQMEMQARPKVRKPRRTAEQRHIRSHW
jgi:hypothetical protein